ncbi:alpha/beta fold hydrolase [Actinomadura decatromicini]|uniref:Alpha/beta fold hydrolase n=1 Tax=Actinomadura decatromicini TaxID=2604572 RepID=A0A5D3F8J2_9ACTN|nr:alpha/beta fold hydrolase [Actinomadura decatromicini]TYK44523.1 alpha/beta fold hydrolase [Actinomadura decatromicini]
MSLRPPPLLFVHGFWFGSWCWSEVLARVTGAGHVAHAVDMAGHGLRARRPRSLATRPFDPDEMAAEPSPVADVGLDQAGELLISQIRRLGRGRPVTAVAHSMGGAVLTRAVQEVPELVAHAVYLTGFMPASGVTSDTYARSPENADSLVTASLATDPARVGAMRLDLVSAEDDYRRRLRKAFFDDIPVDAAEAALGLLTPDGPVAMLLGTTRLTSDGWGSVPRTYVRCEQDWAIRPALQRRFIAEADAAFPDNPTTVVTLDSSHSPFLSMPDRVVDIVTKLD